MAEPAETTLAQQVGAFAAASTFSRLPAEVIDSVRKRILDILGICVAATPLDTSAAARGWVTEQGGRPQAQAIGIAGKVPATLAAFVNGVLAHSLDYDDTHLPSVLHPSASVVPAALAAGQAAGADGRSVIAAVAAGLEVCVRVGMAGYDPQTRNSTFFDHGQHATSIVGALGAAVSAGLLLGLDAAGVTHALGIAASMASGIIEANRTGGTVKRMHCGWAAHAGVSAAQLAAHGFTGPPTVLEGRFGFYQAWLHGKFDPAAITDGLGETWLVPDIFFKPYPANHFAHAAIDAAIELRSAGLEPGDVESATLGVAAPTVHTIGEPIEVKRTPRTGYMAQFSGPYAVAAGLLGGGGLGVGLADFTDELAVEPARRALMARVDVVADDRCSEVFPHQFPAVLWVRTRAGRELVAEVMTNRGGPDRPLSYDELATKYRDNAGRLLDATTVAATERAVANLDHARNLDDLLAPLGQIPDRPSHH
ncbi:MAG TPA: MmgE/PrpD family protein [Streptosporangiaceae bacterium]|nr:MmgE/PrpD family protein [Streptosporangiaceae bacterium]